jgi:hypothetical protein
MQQTFSVQPVISGRAVGIVGVQKERIQLIVDKEAKK